MCQIIVIFKKCNYFGLMYLPTFSVNNPYRNRSRIISCFIPSVPNVVASHPVQFAMTIYEFIQVRTIPLSEMTKQTLLSPHTQCPVDAIKLVFPEL